MWAAPQQALPVQLFRPSAGTGFPRAHPEISWFLGEMPAGESDRAGWKKAATAASEAHEPGAARMNGLPTDPLGDYSRGRTAPVSPL